ncbi:MAG: hypothetical protein QXJ95_05190 [Ignisphaera sp.]|uniref:Uncharacterized protein n=1 Tax=Ignisphaera aggregans TaxID=334771 RepID=A0A7J3JQ69_9CREN
MSEDKRMSRLSYIIALIGSASTILLYVIAMFHAFPAYLDRIIPLNLMRIFFYLILFLIILKEVFPSYRKGGQYITLSLIVISSIYSFTVTLRETSRLNPGYFIIIPPSFIYSRCDIAINCNDFTSISISIPLTIAFILLIYGLYGIFIAKIARSSE